MCVKVRFVKLCNFFTIYIYIYYLYLVRPQYTKPGQKGGVVYGSVFTGIQIDKWDLNHVTKEIKENGDISYHFPKYDSTLDNNSVKPKWHTVSKNFIYN